MTQRLSPSATRRLLRYQERLNGAQSVKQATEQVVANLTEQYSDALRSACEDAEVALPPPGVQAQVNIDWATGDIQIVPTMLESGNGVEVPN